jgi:hypothetical protein
METHDLTDPENVKIGFRDPKPPHANLTVVEAFERFKPECEEAKRYVADVSSWVNPMGPFAIAGHVVEEPVPYGGFLEDSFKPDWEPFGPGKPRAPKP